MYVLKFDYPKLSSLIKISGVYKMTFNTGHFYIGSSSNLFKRINQWRHRLKIAEVTNYKILDILPRATIVYFEILEFSLSGEAAKKMEEEYIKTSFSDELCLNVAISPYTYKGIVKTYRKAKKIVNRKRVAKYDMSGNLICIYESIEMAGIKNGTRAGSIRKVLLLARKSYKGHVYKYYLGPA